jgi:protein-S-isoprenylcysteine O-methyltransferase Ste14
MNTIAYLLYLALTYFITFQIGFLFYSNGKVFVLAILDGDIALTNFINKLLLLLYYLFNLGYCAIMLSTWSTVTSWEQVIQTVLTKTGSIMLTLAMIHYGNIGIVIWYSHRKKIIHF